MQLLESLSVRGPREDQQRIVADRPRPLNEFGRELSERRPALVRLLDREHLEDVTLPCGSGDQAAAFEQADHVIDRFLEGEVLRLDELAGGVTIPGCEQ